jgi:Glycosyl hydrolase family 63 C-terminal domain
MSGNSQKPNGENKRACAETKRLLDDERRARNWKRFGPYLSERQWGTVREDYSEHGSCWDYFPHDHARSRAYRWGEDGLLGFCDRQGRLCFALALWNEQDPILKERLFGLTGPEGNHGEDVKELYYYLDSTPTHSYAKALYKYPQRAFPYAELVHENRRRGKGDPEHEILDSGVFDHGYFDVFAEYAKAGPDDLLVKITIANRGSDTATIHLLPTLWFRNTWSWGRTGEGYGTRPRIARVSDDAVLAEHEALGRFRLDAEGAATWLFTENETNNQRLFGAASPSPYTKDAFHDYLIHGQLDKVNPAAQGTKAAAHYRLTIAAGASTTVRLRLAAEDEATAAAFDDFDAIFALRQAEADAFYENRMVGVKKRDKPIVRQAYAGLLWSKQFYHYDIRAWLEGDPAHPAPAHRRRLGRNAEWRHLYNRDVISMPDKWEYPWYAAWDLAFHMIPFARIDPAFAKDQLLLMLREWYMHPNGQLAAYEFAFGDVNPPVHAWAAWRVYKIAASVEGHRDTVFLDRIFQKLLLNFTWWVNRKDHEGKNIFSGGFLGLDNIGVFDRSQALPTGGHLEQADGTAWMAFYSATMLSMALELAKTNPAYEDMASKFFEHFVGIADAINTVGGTGLWSDEDGFYYDQLHVDGRSTPLCVRSMVGLLPLIAVEVLEDDVVDRLPAFKKRMRWFLENRRDLAGQVSFGTTHHGHALLAIPSRERLVRVLRYLLDESEFLSPFGLRSVSKAHDRAPYVYHHDGQEFRVDYVPGESNTGLFGGNSNWRGPVWFPVNYLLVEALQRYHHFYGDDLQVECPVGSGRFVNLEEAAEVISERLANLFRAGPGNTRPCHGDERRYADDPHFRDLVLFHEYFHAETGRGVGASHQTGWTALVVRLLEDRAQKAAAQRARTAEAPPVHAPALPSL